MQPDKIIARPVEKVGEEVSPACVDDSLVEALQELYRALQKTAIYPPGHPAVRDAAQVSGGLLVAALAGRPSAIVGIARDHLLIDRQPFRGGPAALGALAQLLHGMDVAAIEFRAGLTTGEFERFLVRMRESRHANQGGAALALSLSEDKLDNIRIFPLDYWGISFSAHTDQSRNDANPSDIWEGLVVNLTGLSTPRPEVDPEALAEETNQRFVDEEGVGVGLLRHQIQTVGQQVQGMDGWQREAIRTRLARFVSALNPTLRRDLLRVDPHDAEGSVGTVATIADQLADSTLLDILRDLNHAGQRTHDQFLNFMNKMARLDPSDSPLAQLDPTLERWGISGDVIREDPRAFRTALKEVLLRRKEIDCNPEKYQELLDDLTHRELSPTTRSLCARYVDPTNSLDVKSQTLEMAVRLLEEESAGEHLAGILAHIGSITDPLLDAGKFQPVRDAAVTARSIVGRETASEEARKAAAGYLKDFSLAARIDRILSKAVSDGEVHCAVEPLLALGGAAALDRLIDRLERDLDPAVAAVFQNVAVTMGRRPMSEVIEQRAAEGWDRVLPAVRVVRLLSSPDAVATLEPLAQHQEARIRRETLVLLCELDRSPHGPERHLRRALGDRDPRIVVLAVRKLGELGTNESIEALAGFLAGRLPGAVAPFPFARRAAKILLEMGDRGLHRLCDVLDRRRNILNPSAVRVGAIIHEIVETRAEDPIAARAALRWRFSPAGFAARFYALFPREPLEARE